MKIIDFSKVNEMIQRQQEEDVSSELKKTFIDYNFDRTNCTSLTVDGGWNNERHKARLGLTSEADV